MSLYTRFYSLLIDEMCGYQQPLKLKERTPCSITWSSTAELFTGTGIAWAILGAASMANYLTSWRRVVRTDKARYELAIKACPVLQTKHDMCWRSKLAQSYTGLSVMCMNCIRIHTCITLVWHVSLTVRTHTYILCVYKHSHHTTRDLIGLHSWYSSQYLSPLDFQCKAVPWWLSEHSRQLSHCAILCMIAAYTKPKVTNQHRSFNHPLVARMACLFAISHVEQFHTIPRLSSTSSSFYNTQPSSSFIQFKGEECSQESGTVGPRVVSVLAVGRQLVSSRWECEYNVVCE